MKAPSLLIVGGCRSGKSRFALEWSSRFQGSRAFIATCEPGDDQEMLERVARHQAERGPEWHTLPAPLDPAAALLAAASDHQAAVIDCVTIWLANLLPLHEKNERILDEVRRLAELLRRPPLPVAVVSNEIGLGLAPMEPLSRRFRDLQGEANQILAEACQHAVMCVCGLPMALK